MDPLKTSSTPETKLHFLDYWRIIRIRKTVILAVFLLVVITATIVTFILPEPYSSKARIKVERDVTDVAGVDGQRGFSGYDPYFIQTEFEVIQSEVILDSVIDRLNLNEVWGKKFNFPQFKTSDSRLALRHMIGLHPSRNTSLIDITVYSDDKQEASTIANEIAEVYKDYRLILHLRAGYFMENTLAQVQPIKKQGMAMGPLPPELKLAMIATRDIGAVAAEALVNRDFQSHQTRELVGPREITYSEVATIVGSGSANRISSTCSLRRTRFVPPCSRWECRRISSVCSWKCARR